MELIDICSVMNILVNSMINIGMDVGDSISDMENRVPTGGADGWCCEDGSASFVSQTDLLFSSVCDEGSLVSEG